MERKLVKLYGGAITCEIPSGFDDLSNVFPVPDNQEVFVYHSNGSVNLNSAVNSHDYVLSFEILEYLSDLSDVEAGRKLFSDLSYCNESRDSKIFNLNSVQGTDLGLSELFNAVSIAGTMEVSRSKNKEVYNKIRVLMYNVRMPRYKCELLVSYSYPEEGEHGVENEAMFEGVVRTLKVVNTNLFAT
ncbi:multicopy suppressor of ts gsp1 [Theileria orientalis]|uniref:Multicopy suppressor of ts gsp1 n=1 Tax=Theileria orientalis TaxID=68886 RepID=A0A976QTP7_THEOR|nr:multicopy suppressor of ts gsp1 [Theileria orientalis]